MAQQVYSISTPIYYVNGEPHIGTAYTTTAADVLARFQRLRGRDVLFMTGTDEHATKVAEVARAQGMEPQAFVDSIVPAFQRAWKMMHIEYDDFIRTSEPRHRVVVEEVWRRLVATGDIYKGIYEGWYCVPCETYWRDTEVRDGLCPNAECQRPVTRMEEETYFFRLSRYEDRLLQAIEARPDFLRPDFRRNEVLAFIRQGLRDISVSRPATGWGIPVPEDPSQVIYVWFDALINYLTVCGWPHDEERFRATWPLDVQLMAKEIFVRFHCTFWPAMLMALDLPLPGVIFGHGYWTMEGEKISKSKGHLADPADVANDLVKASGCDFDVAIDALRYYMMREMTFGLDGSFSQEGVEGRFNADLANDLGNLLNRSHALATRLFEGRVPEGRDFESELRAGIESALAEYASQVEDLQFSQGLQTIWRVLGEANKWFNDAAPWRAEPSIAAGVLYTTLEVVRLVSVALSPFMPVASRRLLHQLGVDEDAKLLWDQATRWGGLEPGAPLGQAAPLFPRIDPKAARAARSSSAEPAEARKGKTSMTQESLQPDLITIDDFKRVQLRTARILSAERVQGADKLLQLRVDLGGEERGLVAGIAETYTPEELVGKTVVVVANLQPARIRGIESQGMILAADLGGKAILLTPDRDVPAGATVR